MKWWTRNVSRQENPLHRLFSGAIAEENGNTILRAVESQNVLRSRKLPGFETPFLCCEFNAYEQSEPVATHRFLILSSIHLPTRTKSCGESKGWTGRKPKASFVRWPCSLMAIPLQRTFRAFFDCQDSQTGIQRTIPSHRYSGDGRSLSPSRFRNP